MSYLQRMEKRHPGLRSFLTVLLSAAMVLNSVPTQALAEVVNEPQVMEIESVEDETDATLDETKATEGEQPADEQSEDQQDEIAEPEGEEEVVAPEGEQASEEELADEQGDEQGEPAAPLLAAPAPLTAQADEITPPDGETFANSEFNVLAGDFGEMSNFGLIAFDTLTVKQHIHSNIATDNLVVSSGQGIGTYHEDAPSEVSYIGSSASLADGVSSEIVTLKSGSRLVFGDEIGQVTITPSDTNHSTVNAGNATFSINHSGMVPEECVRQESSGSTYIDLASWKSQAEALSSRYSEFNATQVIREPGDGSYYHLIEKSNTTIACVNITPDNLISPYGNNLPIKIEDKSVENDQHVLVINLDLAGRSDYSFPGLLWDSNEESTGEVGTWTQGNVILNLIDSSQPDNLYRGSFSVDGNQCSAIILAPDAKVVANMNVNGEIIANEIVINEEFHRDSFTFKSTITVKGGLRAAKTLDGNRDLNKAKEAFQFALEPVSAVSLSGDAISDVPMPDGASEEERAQGKMVIESELDGLMRFGYLNFKE